MPLSALFSKVDRESYTDPDMPEYPGLYLAFHVLTAGEIMGATAGSAAGLAMHTVAHLRGKKSLPLAARMLRYAGGGVVFGALAATTMLTAFAITKENMDEDGIADRAFRIQANPLVQAKHSATGLSAMTLGLAAAVPAYFAPASLGGTAIRIVGGYGLGAAIGMLGVVAFARKEGEEQ